MIVIGVFPPPVSGAPAVTVGFGRALAARGIPATIIDLSPGGRLEQSWRARLSRIAPVVAGLGRMCGIARLRTARSVYIALSSGWGRLYDVAFAAIARIAGLKIFLHHHSFGCVASHSRVTGLLCRVAGASAVHVVLCPEMARGLAARYRVGSVRILSNAWAVTEPLSVPASSGPRSFTIGYLGNITQAKGILEFIDLVMRGRQLIPTLAAVIAGPVQAPAMHDQFHERMRAAAPIRYLGAVDGADKTAFFHELDVLIFPSTYVHEAAPLVILEALAHGVPVIARERGCIGSLLSARCGVLLARDRSMVAEAAAILGVWFLDPDSLANLRAGARQEFSRMKMATVAELERLIDGMN